MISRRGFLGALAGVAVAALVPGPVNISVPMHWSEHHVAVIDKFALVRQLMENGIMAHDDAIEEALFRTSNDICRLPSWIEGADRTSPQTWG